MAEEKARDPTMPERKPVNIPLSKIHDLPGIVFAPPSPKSLEALTSSIVLKGIQEPVILRQREDGEFQIVSGNRRRKASELTKKAEIPAFVYDMTEKEAKEFRFRDKGIGTPPGRLLSESEIGKKREEPAKAPEQAAEVKPVPAPEQKKTEEKTKTVEAAKKAEEAQKAVSSEKAGIDGKKPDTPPKSPEKAAEEKTAPAPDIKKPVENTPPAASAEKADAAPKKQDTPPKQPDKPADTKPDTDSKKPPVPEKSPETPAAAKPMPAAMTGPAALGPTGTKITKIFEDRLLPPDEKAKKALPVPKEGESYFITLHPAYLEKSEFNTVSVDVNSDDYKELKKSIELNGVKDPVLTRINAKGGLEILSGQRRHMIARELNYPVPAIIQKIDDNDAMILVADSNLHRPHISTFDLSRTLRNKMTAMKRKAGRKKRGVPGAEELNSDAVLAKEMGISVSKLPFTDVSSNSWYYSSVRSAWEKGLIDGVTASEFRPDATLTVAQAIKLAAALHQLDKTGTVTLRNGSETWYDSYVSYAVANGIIEKDYASYTAAQMNAAITRAEFVHIFHGAESTYKAINQVADDAIPDVKNGDAFASDIYEFYRAGILTGSDVKGTFHPASSIKRSEVATILLRMFETSARKSISLS